MRPVAIIGAGPAGLALAQAMDKKCTPYEIFESRIFGATWRATPPDLQLLSPWWTNVLNLRGLFLHHPFKKVPAHEFLTHLTRIAEDIAGPLREGCEIHSMHRDGAGWWLSTGADTHGPFCAVVVATGYFFTPLSRPDFVNDGTVPCIHSAEISDYNTLMARRGDNPTLIVGRRVTAGQLLVELDNRGRKSALSVRSAVEFRRHGFFAWLREMAYFVWENLEAKIKPGLRRPSFPVMDGGRTRKLIESGKTYVYPRIARIREGRIYFIDGTSGEFSSVILATGFRPGFDLLPTEPQHDEYGLPLMDGFEVRGHPSLFLLGFDNLFDHRSRYLRGIRKDAALLAEQLVRVNQCSSLTTQC